jgi:ribonuclease HI
MVLYVDGGCSANGQLDLTKRRMVAIVTDDQGVVLSERHLSGGSNNIAELIAVRDALIWARDHDQPSQFEIRTDSRNNIAWVFSKKIGKKLNDRAAVEALRIEITQLRQRVDMRLEWIPRDENIAGHVIEKRYGL